MENKNPCLQEIPDYQLTELSQINKIRPDGSFRLVTYVRTFGDNVNSAQDEVYRQIGRMLINGEMSLPDAGGEGPYPDDQLTNTDPNKLGAGVTNNTRMGIANMAEAEVTGKSRFKTVYSYTDRLSRFLLKARRNRLAVKNKKHCICSVFRKGRKVVEGEVTNGPLIWHPEAIENITSLALNVGTDFKQLFFSRNSDGFITNFGLGEPLFEPKVNIQKNYISDDTSIKVVNVASAAAANELLKQRQLDKAKYGLYMRFNADSQEDYPYTTPIGEADGDVSADRIWKFITDAVYYCSSGRTMDSTTSGTTYTEYPLGLSLTQSFLPLGSGSTNANSQQQSSADTICWGTIPSFGAMAGEAVPSADNFGALTRPIFVSTSVTKNSSDNFNLRSILNVFSKGLNVASNVINAVTDGFNGEVRNAGEEAEVPSYASSRIPAASPTLIRDALLPSTYYDSISPSMASITGVFNKNAGYSVVNVTEVDNPFAFVESYGSLFSDTRQSTSTNNATRLSVTYDAVVSYQFYVMHGFTPYGSMELAQKKQEVDTVTETLMPVVLANTSVRFMACLSSVISKDISLDALLKYSVKISETSDDLTINNISNDAQVFDGKAWMPLNSFVTDGSTLVLAYPCGGNADSPLTLLSSSPNGWLQSLQQVQLDSIGYWEGGIKVSAGGVYLLPPTLKDVNGVDVAVTADTPVTIFPIVTCEVRVQPQAGKITKNTNKPVDGYSVYAILPRRRPTLEASYPADLQIFAGDGEGAGKFFVGFSTAEADFSSPDDGVFLGVATNSFQVTQVDPMGNVASLDDE